MTGKYNLMYNEVKVHVLDMSMKNTTGSERLSKSILKA